MVLFLKEKKISMARVSPDPLLNPPDSQNVLLEEMIVYSVRVPVKAGQGRGQT